MSCKQKDPETRQELQAALAKPKENIMFTEYEIEELEGQLADAQWKLYTLHIQKRKVNKKLAPLLRPWEKPRAKSELKILAFVELAA